MMIGAVERNPHLLPQWTYWAPSLIDTGDLEAATKTITATTEPGADDYSIAKTLPKPIDSRITARIISALLDLTIDTIPVDDTTLYCRVYVDAADADHMLFDLNWTTTGAKSAVQMTMVGTKEVIYNLLKDGASHTFKFRLWKAGTGTGIVISVVRLRYGVGVAGATYDFPILISHKGWVSFWYKVMRVPSGNIYGGLSTTTSASYLITGDSTAKTELTATHGESLHMSQGEVYFYVECENAVGLAYLYRMSVEFAR